MKRFVLVAALLAACFTPSAAEAGVVSRGFVARGRFFAPVRAPVRFVAPPVRFVAPAPFYGAQFVAPARFITVQDQFGNVYQIQVR